MQTYTPHTHRPSLSEVTAVVTRTSCAPPFTVTGHRCADLKQTPSLMQAYTTHAHRPSLSQVTAVGYAPHTHRPALSQVTTTVSHESIHTSYAPPFTVRGQRHTLRCCHIKMASAPIYGIAHMYLPSHFKLLYSSRQDAPVTLLRRPRVIRGGMHMFPH